MLTDSVEAFAQPVDVLATPSTGCWATEAGIANSGGQDAVFSSHSDSHQTAGRPTNCQIQRRRVRRAKQNPDPGRNSRDGIHADMNDFLATRREPFLDEASFVWARADLRESAIPEYIETRDAADTPPEGRGSMRWHLSRSRLSLAILLYSGGEDLGTVKAAFSAAVDAFEEHLDGEFPVLDDFDLAIQASYVQALWLLSLARLLGEPSEQIEHIANFYAADETNDGADELFEILLAKLGRNGFPADGMIHEDPYLLLLDCVRGEPEARPGLMSAFLKRWFKGQKECDWWGLHVNRSKTPVLKTGFFGYWAFEAALVTFLWDIDDSSYRDLPHYPKDLADHARKLALSGAANLPARVMGGEPCPRIGHWFTPARLDSRKYFGEGDTLPKVGGDYGATIWQWDDRQ